MRTLFTHSMLQLKSQHLSRQILSLTDKQLRMMDMLSSKFQKARPARRDKIVEGIADNIKNTWTEDAEFDRDKMKSVCESSAKLGHSQLFLAYLCMSVQQVEAQTQKIRIRDPEVVVPSGCLR